MHTATKIVGIYNAQESWEKQSVWDLSNGARVTVGFSHYGDMISRIDLPDNSYWHCSNGLAGLPEFAQPWIETVVPSANTRIVRPGFEKSWS